MLALQRSRSSLGEHRLCGRILLSPFQAVNTTPVSIDSCSRLKFQGFLYDHVSYLQTKQLRDSQGQLTRDSSSIYIASPFDSAVDSSCVFVLPLIPDQAPRLHTKVGE